MRMLDIYDQKSMFSNIKVGYISVCFVRAISTLCVCVSVVRAVRKLHFSFVTNLNT